MHWVAVATIGCQTENLAVSVESQFPEKSRQARICEVTERVSNVKQAVFMELEKG
jgi:hypothetical protein